MRSQSEFLQMPARKPIRASVFRADRRFCINSKKTGTNYQNMDSGSNRASPQTIQGNSRSLRVLGGSTTKV